MHILSFLRLFATASAVLLLHTHQVYAPLLLPRQASSASTGIVPADDVTVNCASIESGSTVFMKTVWGQEFLDICPSDSHGNPGCYTTSSGSRIMTANAYNTGTMNSVNNQWVLNWNPAVSAWSIQARPSPNGPSYYLKGTTYDITLEKGIRATFPFPGMLAQVVNGQPTDNTFYWNIHVKGDPGMVAIQNVASQGWLGKMCRWDNSYTSVCNLGNVAWNQNMLVVYNTFGWARNLLEMGVFQMGQGGAQATPCLPNQDWNA